MEIGLLVALLVLGGTVGLHAAPQQVPLYEGLTEATTGTVPLLVCRGETQHVLNPKVYEPVQEHLAPLGLTILDPQEITCQMCQYGDRFIPCRAGAIVVSLQDQQFHDNHAGETVIVIQDGRVAYGSIMLPEEIWYQGKRNPEAYVLAHQILHWAGYQHVWTPILPGLHAVPTGHLMNPSLKRVGWSVRGI